MVRPFLLPGASYTIQALNEKGRCMALSERAPQGPLVNFFDRMLVHPVRAVPLAFGAMALVGTLLLMLPAASRSGDTTPMVDALFTAVSALCVTGLVTLDTGTHWSAFGQGVILALIQLGGLGLMLVGALLAGLIWKRLSQAQQRLTGAENVGLTSAAQIRPAARLIFGVAVVIELTLAAILALRFWNDYAMSAGEAAWSGLFHAVSAYNNAGFGLRTDSAMGWASDPLILIPLAVAILIGGLGLPLLWDVRAIRLRQRSRWSLHTKLTLGGMAMLLLLGFVGTLLFEWHGVLSGQGAGQKLLSAAFYSVSLRTAGFNNFAMDDLSNGTMLMSSVLMFIGAGSASTGGGIKVATAMILVLVVVSELRGNADVTGFGRRISPAVQRRAMAIILLALAIIVSAALAIGSLAPELGMRDIAFECVSAFATVGLSTGITPLLPEPAKLIIILLMFIGRVGPVTIGAALILRSRKPDFRYPQEDPIIG
jgi:trk system potassium uptake protein